MLSAVRALLVLPAPDVGRALLPAILPGMREDPEAESLAAGSPAEAGSSSLRPPTFDRTAVRLLVAALIAGVLTLPVVMLWRGFSWLMALPSAAGIAVLIFLCGRAVRVLNFEWRRPPFEREK